MKNRCRLAILLAGGHVTLVACGAAGVTRPSATGLVGRAVAYYGELSGASNRYGFYAPAVGTELRVTFTVTDGSGRARDDVLAVGCTHEARLRLGSLADMYVHEECRPALGAAWAAALFGRHPEAERVTLRVEEYDVPTMAGYRAGARPRWRVLSGSTFSRAGGDRTRQEGCPV